MSLSLHQVLLVVGTAAVLSAVAIVRSNPPEQRALRSLVGVMVLLLIFAIGGVGFHADPSHAWAWIVVIYSGLIPVGPTFWVLARRAVEIEGASVRGGARREAAITAATFALWLTMATNPWHDLFLTPRPGGRGDYHFAWWAHTGFSYGLILTAVRNLAVARRRVPRGPRRKRLTLLMVAPLFGVGSSLLFVLAPGELSLDPTAIGWTIAILILAAATRSFGLFDTPPVTPRRILEHSLDGVVVTNRDDQIVYSNSLARQVLGTGGPCEGDVLSLIARSCVDEPAPPGGWQTGAIAAQLAAGEHPVVAAVGNEHRWTVHLDREGEHCWVTLREATAELHARKAIEERDALVRRVATLSHRMLSVDIADLPATIQTALDELAVYAAANVAYSEVDAVSRTTTIRFLSEVPTLRNRGAPIRTKLREGTTADELMPNWFRRLVEGETIIAAEESVPVEWPERMIFEQTGAKVIVVVPSELAGSTASTLTVTTYEQQKRWAQADVELFRIVTDLVHGALLRDRKERDLRDALERLANAHRQARVALWRYDFARDEFEWEGAVREIVGQDVPLRRRADVLSLIDPSNPFGFEDLVAGRAPRDFTIRLSDGSLRRLTATVNQDRGADGELVGLNGTVQDITHRWRMANALIQSELDHRELLRTAPNPILVVVPQTGAVLYANRAAEQAFPLPDSMTPASLADFFEASTALDLSAIVQAVVADGAAQSARIHSIARPGLETRQMEVAGAPTRFEGEMAAQLVFLDVTEERRLAGEIDRGRRLDLLARIARGVAHDFNNLLMVIQSNAEILEFPGGASPREVSRRILGAVQRASDLVHQLLGFARANPANQPAVVFEINAALERLAAIVAFSIPSRIQFELDLTAEHCFVRGRVSEIERVWINLLSNAQESIEGRGTITLETRRVRGSDPTRPSDLSSRHWVMVAVRDDGCGMDEQTADRLFEPYFSTKGIGRGLGLSASHGIVLQHGGRVVVKSKAGAGSELRVFLPIVPENTEEDAPDGAGRE